MGAVTWRSPVCTSSGTIIVDAAVPDQHAGRNTYAGVSHFRAVFVSHMMPKAASGRAEVQWGNGQHGCQGVGDVDGHTMTLIRYSGIASLADGSVGTANITAVADYIKGSGTYTGYYNVTLKDGSISYKATNAPARLGGR